MHRKNIHNKAIAKIFQNLWERQSYSDMMGKPERTSPQYFAVKTLNM
jgi:hypothetical protein